MGFHAGFYQDLALDLGTGTTRLSARGKGILLRAPTVAAVEPQSGRVACVGAQALALVEARPGEVLPLHPLRRGVITDYSIAQAMLQGFLKGVRRGGVLGVRLLVCVPSGISQVEERAMVEAGLRSGAKKVYLLEKPLAAALGAGLEVEKNQGRLLVDVGRGTTDLGILALGGVAASACLPLGGEDFDAALVDYVRDKHRLLLGRRGSELAKQALGLVSGAPRGEGLTLKGRCLDTQRPREISLTPQETQEAFLPLAKGIARGVRELLDRTPPSLGEDVAETGLLLTGGGSLLRGMGAFLAQETGLAVTLGPEPLDGAALGAAQLLPTLAQRQEGVVNLARRALGGE